MSADNIKWVDGVEYEWRGKALGWRATGNHESGITNTPHRGEPEGSRDRKPRLEPDSAKRKEMPIYSGVFRYFPDALAEIARLSKIGNDKHNPGESLHWARGKSTDELDALCRHLAECGVQDTDGFYHDVKVAWRALANLQKLLEKEKGLPISPGSKTPESKPIDEEIYAKVLRQYWDTRDPYEACRIYNILRGLRPNQPEADIPPKPPSDLNGWRWGDNSVDPWPDSVDPA